MQQIKISEVTSQKLKNREYEDVFPEYYDLENYVENNIGHDNQSVLDHVIAVFEGLEKVLLFEDLSSDKKEKANTYLNKQETKHTRLELMKIASLLHDIGKSKMIIKNGDIVSCPGHELVGASMVKNFSERFELDDQEELLVEKMVRYHGLVWELLNYISKTNDRENYFKVFIDTVGDVALELILMTHSDLLGSDLEKNAKETSDEIVETLIWLKVQLL